jgi:DNA mismatch repair protein MutS
VEHFRTKTLEGFGCEHLGLGIRAAGGLLSYLKDTQKVPLKHLTRVQPFQSGKVMPIDRATRRALEITETLREGERSGTLLASLDHTLTAAGGRKLRDWLLAPLTDVDAIVERQSGVAELVEQKALRETLSDLLRRVHDVERICTRISYGSASPRDLVALARSLEVVPGVHAALAACRSPVLAATSRRLGELPELRDELTRALVPEPPLSPREGGLLRQGYNAELDELREVAREGSHWFARFQEKEVERSGIPSLKVGYNRIFGYYIEVTNPHRDKVPADYVRKQTLKNCERYINADLKDYESKVLNAREAAMDLEYKVFLSLRGAAEAEIAQLQENAAALAELDVLDAFARLAHERRYVRPEVNGSSRLFIEDGRHPVVEEVATTEPFIPNSVDLGEEARIMIITGPNMAGKSTYIRQVALLTLLAQVGCFIPAKRAEIGIADRIFTRVGSGDDLTRGQSTFMVEMSETANILNNATSRSLVVLDEVGRGTSTYDGLSLAWSITEHIAEHIGARTLFATHYHELTALSTSYAGVRNFNFAVKEWNEDIIFLRKLIEGGADKSYGIHVARLAGIPDGVLDRAKEVLANLENQSRDVHDQPALARRRRRPAPSAAAGSRTLQLDLFHNINDEVLKEIQALAIDGMTPLEALQYLAGLKKRIV